MRFFLWLECAAACVQSPSMTAFDGSCPARPLPIAFSTLLASPVPVVQYGTSPPGPLFQLSVAPNPWVTQTRCSQNQDLQRSPRGMRSSCRPWPAKLVELISSSSPHPPTLSSDTTTVSTLIVPAQLRLVILVGGSI
jgi:hypothetical protein